MASYIPQINPTRLRSYISRLPFFTRIVLLLIILLWVLGLQSAWNVTYWGALIPQEVNLSTSKTTWHNTDKPQIAPLKTLATLMNDSLTSDAGTVYRTNTYPLIHRGFFHAFFNTVALVPLMERFESEQGTLLTGAFFAGPLSTLPAGLYLLIERGVLRGNTMILGASVWVFVLLGIEGMKTSRANPYFALGPYRIPTWTTPLVLLVFVTALVPIPNASFLGHLCSISIGYVYGLGYLRILAPPERILRWIEEKLNLLGRLPHYVSIDQKTYGRYGVLPTSSA